MIFNVFSIIYNFTKNILVIHKCLHTQTTINIGIYSNDFITFQKQ